MCVQAFLEAKSHSQDKQWGKSLESLVRCKSWVVIEDAWLTVYVQQIIVEWINKQLNLTKFVRREIIKVRGKKGLV